MFSGRLGDLADEDSPGIVDVEEMQFVERQGEWVLGLLSLSFLTLRGFPP